MAGLKKAGSKEFRCLARYDLDFVIFSSIIHIINTRATRPASLFIYLIISYQ